MQYANCPDCFKDVRSRNDKLIQTRIDASQFAKEENKKVAIIDEGFSFAYQVFEGFETPPGTIEIITP